MHIIITGTSSGIGRGTAIRFLNEGHQVLGIDRKSPDPDINRMQNYTHLLVDVRNIDYSRTKHVLPQFAHPDIIISNAGTQNEDDIEINLKSAIRFTEAFAFQPNIKSVLFVGSASAHTGDEFPEYVASKGGLLSYTKNVARRVACFGATCNSLDPGGVLTDLNKPVMQDKKLWKKIMNVTPLKRWATVEEIAEWIYFLTMVNKSCTGQNILNDNGESLINNFVWSDTQ